MVRVKPHPTRMYLENQIEDDATFCYTEKQVKGFVEKTETEYLHTLKDEELFLMNEKGW